MSLQVLPASPWERDQETADRTRDPRDPEPLMLADAWRLGLLSTEELEEARKRLERIGVPYLTLMY